MSIFFILIFFISIPSFLLGMVIPEVFSRFFKDGVTRKKLAKLFGAIMIGSLFAGVATASPIDRQKNDEIIPKDGIEKGTTEPIPEINTDEPSEPSGDPGATIPVTEQSDSQAENVSDSGDDEVTSESKSESEPTVDTSKDSEPLSGSREAVATKITSVVDGDTVKVEINGTRETIRIIGINTPETVDPRKPVECFGKEASAKAKELLDGKMVTLETDTTQGERDKYGRLLRYIFLSDGSDFGKKMIHDGYAYEYTYSTAYTYQQEYKAAQKDAQNTKRGLWAEGACDNFQADSGSTTSSTTTEVAPTPAPPTASATTSCSCSSNSYNCGDFSTHAEAQEIYDCCMAQVGSDIHKLDGSDNDGQACESLP